MPFRPISTAPDSAVRTSPKEGARKSVAREILTTADGLSTAAIKTDQLCEEDELGYDQYIEVSENYEYSTQSDADRFWMMKKRTCTVTVLLIQIQMIMTIWRWR